MNDHDDPLDRKLQALLDDRLGDRRDAGLRSATLDPVTRRALGAYKAVYRALRNEPPSTLPDDFAARVAAAARGESYPSAPELAAWQIAALAAVVGVTVSAFSIAAIAKEPGRILAAFQGPLGPLTVALIAAVVLDQLLTQRDTHRS